MTRSRKLLIGALVLMGIAVLTMLLVREKEPKPLLAGAFIRYESNRTAVIQITNSGTVDVLYYFWLKLTSREPPTSSPIPVPHHGVLQPGEVQLLRMHAIPNADVGSALVSYSRNRGTPKLLDLRAQLTRLGFLPEPREKDTLEINLPSLKTNLP